MKKVLLLCIGVYVAVYANAQERAADTVPSVIKVKFNAMYPHAENVWWYTDSTYEWGEEYRAFFKKDADMVNVTFYRQQPKAPWELLHDNVCTYDLKEPPVAIKHVFDSMYANLTHVFWYKAEGDSNTGYITVEFYRNIDDEGSSMTFSPQGKIIKMDIKQYEKMLPTKLVSYIKRKYPLHSKSMLTEVEEIVNDKGEFIYQVQVGTSKDPLYFFNTVRHDKYVEFDAAGNFKRKYKTTYYCCDCDGF